MRGAEAFVPELTEATLVALHVRERKKYADLLSEVLCACMKDTKQKKVSPKFPEENITSGKLQAE